MTRLLALLLLLLAVPTHAGWSMGTVGTGATNPSPTVYSTTAPAPNDFNGRDVTIPTVPQNSMVVVFGHQCNDWDAYGEPFTVGGNTSTFRGACTIGTCVDATSLGARWGTGVWTYWWSATTGTDVVVTHTGAKSCDRTVVVVVTGTTSSGIGNVAGARPATSGAITTSISAVANKSLLLWSSQNNPTTYTGAAAASNTMLDTTGSTQADTNYTGAYNGVVSVGNYTVGSSDTCFNSSWCTVAAIEIKAP